MTNLKVKVTSFKLVIPTFRTSMNSSSVMVKFQKGQFDTLKLIFCKLKGQYLTLKVKVKVISQGHQFLFFTQLKFEAEIVHNCCFHKELHKIFKFKFYLEGEGQGHQFLNTSETFR